MQRFGFFNAAIRKDEITTANQRRIDELVENLLDVNGVTHVTLGRHQVKVVFHADIITSAEVDAIVTKLVTDAALNTPLFPDVKSNGKIKRHPATDELKLDKKTFKVVMSNRDARPEPEATKKYNRTETNRVFDLNTLIVGRDEKDGSKQTKVTEEFAQVLGAKLAKVDGITGWTTWDAQVKVTFFVEIISAAELIETVNRILQEIHDDPNYDNFFPHTREKDGKSLKVDSVWTSSTN